MGAASHLGINLREYDARIRTFIPRYEAMLDAAAAAVPLADRSAKASRYTVGRNIVVDLGIGTGALAARVLRIDARARIVGIDSDEAMLAVARRRIGARLTTVHGDFERVLRERRSAKAFALRNAFERRDAAVALHVRAMTASFALHHVPTRRRKAALYRHAFAALARGGVLASADYYPAADARLQRIHRDAWRAHLERAYSRQQAAAYFTAWARDDMHFTLDEETRMLRAAGFSVEITWRVGGFAVVVALKR